jgi:hypothetical protein
MSRSNWKARVDALQMTLRDVTLVDDNVIAIRCNFLQTKNHKGRRARQLHCDVIECMHFRGAARYAAYKFPPNKQRQ